ncbi:hypothetical protein SmJEL517_g03244 [Synchytrium microbalum]|uniref:Brix domain-containing protein n=1 Tax=Synchytrium microbalum TaxID=1806994 RepID=A0A507C918_9FUNG|nr:uncharacterized protein SmJEL517_g03244 [Synchytrium microbalum]TPX34005.1 hypothetical protein SmJEL517_g03244 [Synchytrium microbalum]
MSSVEDLSLIRNKQKREELYHRLKTEKARLKLKKRLATRKQESEHPELKQERLATNVPKTLENTREFDETIVGDDEEVLQEEETDELAGYFNGARPKIMVTTNKRATADIYEFVNEIITIFPDAQFVKRLPQFDLKKVVEVAREREFTDIIVVHEDNKIPNGLMLIHLPDGPTAYFKLSSIKLNKDISGHGRVAAHNPELILNNFSTRLGHTAGRMFAALFPQVPEFQYRQVATFHNQRDFIFFRRHRYIFQEGKRVDLQEVGPRFTLKLQWLQKGTFDTKFGDYEWIFKPKMATSRRRFFFIRTFYTWKVPASTPRLTLDDGSTLIYRNPNKAHPSTTSPTLNPIAATHLPPPIRKEPSYPRLTPAQITRIAELRNSDPDLWTVKTLATEFNTYPAMIMRIVRVPDDRRQYLVGQMDRWWVGEKLIGEESQVAYNLLNVNSITPQA